MKPEIKTRLALIRNGEVPNGYKKTQLGIVPDNWNIVLLGDVFSERVERNREDSPLLSITGTRGVIPRSEIAQKDSSSEDKSKYLRICNGDIGYNTMRMWQGVSALSDHEGIVSPAYTILKPSSKICAKYFAYLFKTEPIIFKFYRYSQGLVDDTRSLKFNSFSKIKITTPPLPEQKKIASILSAQDKVIELCERKIEQLKRMKKYYLQNMFPKDGEEYPEIRFKGFTDAWEQRKLGELADIIGGGTPSTSNNDYWDGDIDWYAPAEIADQIYVASSERKITQQGYENSSAKMLPVGTVLFTSRAGIGKTAILRKEGCTNQGFQSIVPHENLLDSYFIYSRTEELKRYGEIKGAGSTFVEVSGKQMASMELMMPKTIEEQAQIGTYFRQLDHLITLHQRKCEEEKKKKKALQQLLLTGLVRV